MGLRDYEFDVAPELVAALVRGTPGPLRDRAMVHASNVAEAAEALRERERQARLRDSAAAVEGTVSAALNGVEAAIGSVNDRGLFDAGRVGEGLPGGPEQVGGGLGPSGLGPGRGAGRIGIGKHGFVRGSTVQDFITGLGVSEGGRVTNVNDAETNLRGAPDASPHAALENAWAGVMLRAS